MASRRKSVRFVQEVFNDVPAAERDAATALWQSAEATLENEVAAPSNFGVGLMQLFQHEGVVALHTDETTLALMLGYCTRVVQERMGVPLHPEPTAAPLVPRDAADQVDYHSLAAGGDTLWRIYQRVRDDAGNDIYLASLDDIWSGIAAIGTLQMQRNFRLPRGGPDPAFWTDIIANQLRYGYAVRCLEEAVSERYLSRQER